MVSKHNPYKCICFIKKKASQKTGICYSLKKNVNKVSTLKFFLRIENMPKISIDGEFKYEIQYINIISYT